MRKAILGLVVVLLLAGLYIYLRPASSSQPVSNASDSAVRNVVTEFGTKLQMVSLLASTEERKSAMDKAYGSFVSPELLAKWYPEGSEALGRYSSSPWPDRINVVEVRPQNEKFIVEGNVIEVVQGEAETKEATAVYPVTLTLEKMGGRWLIIEAKKGSYGELPQRKTIIGYWECLPHKNTSGPQTTECAFGVAVDQSDGHYAVDTSLMSTYPVDFATGTKVRVTDVVTPANQLSSPQKYDIDGIIRATTIEKI